MSLRTVFRSLTPAEVTELAAKHHVDITAEEAEDFADMISEKAWIFERLEELRVPAESITYTDRNPGGSPDPDGDPYNAFVTKCEVKGAENGRIAGYDVGVKDNIPVANVELTCGSPVFEGYVPSFDATVVSRLLDEGATVVGKTNMDEMAVSGSGELAVGGPVLNPRKEGYLAGGSSGGSAVAVVTGDVDFALGTDQAGSLRVPAAWTGCVGFKPTYGLLPYTGCVSVGPTYDHVGPIARHVRDCALAIDVMAGRDPKDPRQGRMSKQDYVGALSKGIEDLSIGVLREGFGLQNSKEVDTTVRDAIEEFRRLGATVEEISVPLHSDGIIIWLGVNSEESAALFRDGGVGYFMNGEYPIQYLREFVKSKRVYGGNFAPTVIMKMILGQFLQENFHGQYHAKAQNLRQRLTDAYDDALTEVDLLVLPTTPTTAFEVKEGLTRKELVDRAQGKEGRTQNTMPFNMSGHPAISVPCGTVDDLPVGLMLVGQHFDDATVLRAAHAYEQATAPI